MKKEITSYGKMIGKSWWWIAKEIENNEGFNKSLSNGSINQSIYWIRVPSQKWNCSFEKRDDWEETSINN